MQEIADLRKECSKLRRRLQRAKTQSYRDSQSVDYKAARKMLRQTIRRSKILCWQKLVEDVNRDPRGLGYKIVTKKLGSQTPGAVMDVASMETIIGTLFPTHFIILVKTG